jgi:hypothetical protein
MFASPQSIVMEKMKYIYIYILFYFILFLFYFFIFSIFVQGRSNWQQVDYGTK